MVTATGNRFLTASQSNAGTTASGNWAWILNRSPIVSMVVMDFHQINSQCHNNDGDQ